MIKKSLLILLFFSLFLISGLTIIPKEVANAACSLGVLSRQSISAPQVLDKNTPMTISISNASTPFRGRFVYFYIISTIEVQSGNSIGGYFSSIPIDEIGNGQTTFLINDYFQNLQPGPANLVISDAPFTGQNNWCTPNPIGVEVTGDSNCLELGAPCTPATTTPFCNPNAICGENGLVQLPTLSEFEYICSVSNPPTCRECEITPDGTRICGDLNPARPVNCAEICAQAETETTGFLVASGCDDGPGRVNTAIGCIPFTLVSDTTKFFLTWSLSIGGGLGLLLIGISGFMFATSGGNPEKLNSAKSLFTASITGLLMLLLSVFLLRFIGVDILGLFAQ